jgi:hypothetical protein
MPLKALSLLSVRRLHIPGGIRLSSSDINTYYTMPNHCILHTSQCPLNACLFNKSTHCQDKLVMLIISVILVWLFHEHCDVCNMQ